MSLVSSTTMLMIKHSISECIATSHALHPSPDSHKAVGLPLACPKLGQRSRNDCLQPALPVKADRQAEAWVHFYLHPVYTSSRLSTWQDQCARMAADICCPKNAGDSAPGWQCINLYTTAAQVEVPDMMNTSAAQRRMALRGDEAVKSKNGAYPAVLRPLALRHGLLQVGLHARV